MALVSVEDLSIVFGGLAVLLLTLNGPLHDLSDYYLFSAHMVQHLLLTLVVPPLLLAGTPARMLDALLARQDVLARLKKRHGVTLSAVLEARERLAAELDGLVEVFGSLRR